MNHFNINGCPSQHGKVSIVTGANIGLGYETTLALAKKEMTVVMACRDLTRGEEARNKIKTQTHLGEVVLMPLDLSSRRSIEDFSNSFLDRFDRLDVLINNAGIMLPPYQITEDGFESQMGVNYFGHFLLTSLLFRTLDLTPNSKVVSLSSIAHRRGKINFKDINSQKRYVRFRSYAQSKLACLLFSLELDRRLTARGSSVLSLCAHPGVALTNLGRHTFRPLFWLFYPLAKILLQNAREGAEPILLAALGYPGNSKEIKGGDYFGPTGFLEWGGRAGKAKISPHALNQDMAQRLWEVSEEALGIDFFSPLKKNQSQDLQNRGSLQL